MRSFDLYHTCPENFGKVQKMLIEAIVQIADPESIYLLGTNVRGRKTESVFRSTIASSQHVTGFFLLILMNGATRDDQYRWQDKIEQKTKSIVPVTTIVLSGNEFECWLKNGQSFAVRVWEAALLLYGTRHAETPITKTTDMPVTGCTDENRIEQGLIRAKTFFSGAELFRVQQYNNMAAFMLHQSMEHILHALIRAETGYYIRTHSIERLLSYASFVSPQLLDIFVRDTEEDKRTFSLLQKAYIDARYSDHYKISSGDLLALMEKVRQSHKLLSDMQKKTGLPQHFRDISY
jgi:HEPN domain-containing protein